VIGRGGDAPPLRGRAQRLHRRVVAVSNPSFERPFVPAGVNANVWLGFEGRVRQRRFHALVESIEKAIARGDLDAAATALDEAESLQPHAPQLAGVRATLARLSAPNPTPRAWRRPLSAILLPIIGMILLTFADSLRHRETSSAMLGPPLTQAGVPLSIPDALVVQSPEPSPALPSQLRQQPSATATIGDRTPPRAVPTAMFSSVALLSEERDASTTRAPRLERPRQPITRTPTPALSTPPPVAASTPSAPAPDMGATVPALPAREGVELLAVRDGIPPPVAAPVIADVAESLDRRDVTATLNAYAHAFAQLDARAARAVWPSVDERALARAFAGLTSQDIAFDDCAINVHGARADAACRGTASYVAKIGKDERRVEPRTWQFQLERAGDAWKIATAEARRP
jgi:hypothetical protein